MNNTTESMSDEELVKQFFVDEPGGEDDLAGETQSETQQDDDTLTVEASDIGDDEITDEPVVLQEPTDDEGDDGDVEEPDDADDEQLVDVKVDGETRKVPLQEVINDYAGRASLNARHEQLSAAEAQAVQNVQSLQPMVQTIVQMAQLAEQGMLIPRPQPPQFTQEDYDRDPLAWNDAQFKYQQDFAAWSAQDQQVKGALQAYAEQQAKIAESQLQEQVKALRSKYPKEAATEESWNAFRKGLFEGAQKHYGIPPEALSSVTHAGAVDILNDALQYRALKQAEQASKKPTEQPRAVTKKRGKSQTSALQQQQQLAKAIKSQNIEDFLPLMFET